MTSSIRLWRISRILAAMLTASVIWMPAASAERFAVHLPSHRAESAGRLATGLDQLTTRLEQALGGMELQVEIFRKQEDLDEFLRRSPDVILVLSEESFLSGSPIELEPVGRFVLSGVGSYRRVVVVPAPSSARRLADLRGQELTVVRTAASLDHLASSVFADELDPKSYFSSLRQVVDDSEAVTDVLFGQATAALVAEHCPLLQSNLDSKLRVIYRGNPISLPLISVRADLLDESKRQSLSSALAQMTLANAGSMLSHLGFEGFEGFEPVRGTGSRVGSSAGAGRTMDLALDVEWVEEGPRPVLPDRLPLPYIIALPDLTPIAEAILGEQEP